jgi:hypothetical protein
MKTLQKMICIVVTLAASEALALTAKEKALFTTLGGCATGGGVGAYLDARDDHPRKSTQGTIASSALIGCATGALFSWIFMDDDQAALARDNDNLRKKLSEYDTLLRTKGGPPDKGMKFEDSITSSSIPKGSLPGDLSILLNPGCRAVEFRLGFDQSGNRDAYIPVNGQVAIQAFRYYLVVPEDGSDRDCVKPDPGFGYLEKEFTNLGEILINKGVQNGRVQ